jgi:autotransporter-associated beta strand protein
MMRSGVGAIVLGMAVGVSPRVASAADSPTSAWNGSVGTAWNNATNWASGLPGTTNGAVFDSSFANQPMLTASATTLGLWLKTGVGQDVTVDAATPQTLFFQTGATNNGLNGVVSSPSFLNGVDVLMDDSANHNLTFGPNVTLVPGVTTTIYVNNTGTLTIQGKLSNVNGQGVALAGTNAAGVVNITGTVTNGGGGSITVATAGTVILASPSPAYSQGVALNAGILRLNHADALKRAPLALNAGLLQLRSDSDGATFCSSATATVFGASNTASVDRVDLVGGTASNNTLRLLAVNPGNGARLTVLGGHGYSLAIGSMVFGNGFPSTTTLNPMSAALTVGRITSVTMQTGGQTVSLNGTTTGNAVTGAIVNAAAGSYSVNVSKDGAGTWTLGGSNDYTGTTTINAGALNAAHPCALGFGGPARINDTGAVAVNNAGSALNLVGVTVNKAISLTTGTLVNNAANTAATLDSGIASVTFTYGGSGFAVADLGKPLTLSGGGSGAGATIAALSASSNTLSASGGTGWYTGNTLTLSGGGANPNAVYTVAAIAGGAITNLTLTTLGYGYTNVPTGFTAAKGTGAGGPGSGASIAYNDNFAVAAIAMTGAGSGYLAAPAVSVAGVSGSGLVAQANLSALRLFNPPNLLGGNGDLVINPAITNVAYNGTFSKIGSGVLTLRGANVYPGPTVISNGTLSAANASGSATGYGTVTVTNGATLAGSGYIEPTGASGTLIVLAPGAHVSPHVGTGASNSTLRLTVSTSTATNAMYIAGGTFFDFNFGPPGTCDSLSVAGNVALGAGTNTLNIGQLAGFDAGTYTLIGLTSGTLSYGVGGWTLPSSTKWIYTVTNTATTVVLNVTARPPAGTAVFVR